MARAKKQVSGEVTPPDFEYAGRVYRNDVKPANKQQKQAMKEAGDAWKVIKSEAHVNKAAFQQAAKVAEMDEGDQQSWLRSFRGGLDEFNVVLHADLADKAAGVNSETLDVVPIGAGAVLELPEID